MQADGVVAEVGLQKTANPAGGTRLKRRRLRRLVRKEAGMESRGINMDPVLSSARVRPGRGGRR